MVPRSAPNRRLPRFFSSSRLVLRRVERVGSGVGRRRLGGGEGLGAGGRGVSGGRTTAEAIVLRGLVGRGKGRMGGGVH